MLNKAILMGRLTADPELRHTQSNTAVVNFTLAVDRAYSKDREKQTDFIEVVAWRSTAEFAFKYFRKGQLVAVCGSIQTRTWEDKQGSKRKAVEVVADEVHFAEPKRDSTRRTDDQGSSPSADDAYEFMDYVMDNEKLPF